MEDRIGLVDQLGDDAPRWRHESIVYWKPDVVLEMADVLDRAGRQVVEHVHVMAAAEQFVGEMRADESRAACD